MDTETLRREDTRMLFGADLIDYRRAVMKTVEEALLHEDLNDPQTVLRCLRDLRLATIKLDDMWLDLMIEERSDDDEPDPEPSKDSGDV